MVLGVLVLLEGALTVLWKEPFSALLGSSKSEEAHGEELEQTKRAAQAARERREAIHRRALSLNRKAPAGEAIGRLRIPKIDLKTPVVQGTREDSDLTKGPGHYVQTPLPGTKGDWTVGVAGHRTTYGAEFRRLDRLDKGDTMTLTLPYGRFTYAVERPDGRSAVWRLSKALRAFRLRWTPGRFCSGGMAPPSSKPHKRGLRRWHDAPLELPPPILSHAGRLVYREHGGREQDKKAAARVKNLARQRAGISPICLR